MARRPISQLPDWELVHSDDDIRGHTLMDENGNRIGKVSELILDTEMARVVEIILDNGNRYSADRIDIRDGRPILLSRPMARPHEREREERTLPLAEERLRIRRTREKTGDVEIGKEVTSHRETMEVPVSHEEVYIEEEEVSPRHSDRPIGEGRDETFTVPVYEDEVHPEKETVVSREVHVGKVEEEETETISEELRKQEPRVRRHGDVDVNEERERERRERERKDRAA